MAGSLPTGPDRELDPRHLTGVLVGAFLLGLYAAWMAADLVARWFIFVAVALIAGYILYDRREPRSKTVFVGYSLAGLLALTPVFFVLPDVFGDFTGASDTTFVFGLGNLFLVILFIVPSIIVAYVTFRYSGGRGILTRIRLRVQSLISSEPDESEPSAGSDTGESDD
jgi:hypothetical protein